MVMNLIAELEAEQIAELKKDIPDFKAGDTIRVGYKVKEGSRTRIQNYEGVCIARKGGNGIGGSFTVRKISFGEGVERVFPLHSTNIDSISVVRRGRVRRAKLYFSAIASRQVRPHCRKNELPAQERESRLGGRDEKRNSS